MPSPRALLGVAPAMVVFAGSFLLSRNYVREGESDADARAVQCEIVQWPTAADQDRLHRVALKQETVDDLLDGMLTFAEAIERFEILSNEGPSNPQPSAEGETDSDRALAQVLAFARVRAGQDPQRFQLAITRVESEARAFPTSSRRAN